MEGLPLVMSFFGLVTSLSAVNLFGHCLPFKSILQQPRLQLRNHQPRMSRRNLNSTAAAIILRVEEYHSSNKYLIKTPLSSELSLDEVYVMKQRHAMPV
jgi:hypothetical protein